MHWITGAHQPGLSWVTAVMGVIVKSVDMFDDDENTILLAQSSQLSGKSQS